MLRNNLLYQQLHEKVFSLFAPTIRTIYKCQIITLKKELMKNLVRLFGQVFKQKVVDSIDGEYLKVVWDNYRTSILDIPNY